MTIEPGAARWYNGEQNAGGTETELPRSNYWPVNEENTVLHTYMQINRSKTFVFIEGEMADCDALEIGLNNQVVDPKLFEVVRNSTKCCKLILSS